MHVFVQPVPLAMNVPEAKPILATLEGGHDAASTHSQEIESFRKTFEKSETT